MLEVEKKNYSTTLNLPTTEFPMRGNLPEREPYFLEKMQNMELYEKALEKNKKTGKRFTLHDGPPYANGNIHLGHAFNKTLKDIVVRYKTMTGHYSPYIPGWDTHGLPIEKKVQQQMGIDKDTVGIPKFRKICEEYALSQVEIQKEQFKRLGGLGNYEDPSKRYLTLEPKFEAKQIEVFADMYKKGYIYRDLKPVYWCRDCETALAEAEIEYRDDTTTSIYVKFSLQDDKGLFSKHGDLAAIFFVIWTTTPWTIPGNLAVTVNKDFEYSMVEVGIEKYIIATELVKKVMEEASILKYKIIDKFKGEVFENMLLKHPTAERYSRVLLGSDQDLMVTLDAGTGCVHTAPGFGHEDYLVCKRYGDVGIIVPVDEKGIMTEEAGMFSGMSYEDANKKIIEYLDETNHLLAKAKITHPYPHCWRCHQPVIYRATTQWFASVSKFKDATLEAVKGVEWFPKWGEERMLNMLKDRNDWCISRQRVWGVPIPILYCEDCNKELINEDTIASIVRLVKISGTNIWYEMTAEQIIATFSQKPVCSCGCEKYIKETDIMDVWFDSGTTHFSVLGEGTDLEWPADMYLEGNDQYRGWFQSSLLTSIAVTGKAPYKSVVTHGFLVDGDGRKMSKSIGNGIDPLDVINKFGADILRFWTISSDYQTDVRVSTDILNQVAEVYKKIRNTIRFMLGNLSDFNPDMNYIEYENRDEIDRYIMGKTNALVKEVIDAYEVYDFHVVYNKLHRFSTQDLSATYLDVIKDRLYTSREDDSLRRSSQSTMFDILNVIVRLMAPVLCFTAEEVWSFMRQKTENNNVEAVLLTDMPEYNEKYVDENLNKKFEKIYELRDKALIEIEKARAEKIVGHPLDAGVTITAKEKDFEWMMEIKDILEMLLVVSKVEILKGAKEEIKVEKAPGYKCARCWKYNEDVGRDKYHEDICPHCIETIK